MKLPEFYNKHTYNKEAIVVINEKAMNSTCAGFAGKVNIGQELSLPIEIKDINDEADCKIGSISYNFWFRTPHGINMKFFENAKQLEKSVRLSLAKRGFTFLRWQEIEPIW